jgi:hypothetical protein
LGLPLPAKRKALSAYEVKLLAAEARVSYIGLLIGVAVGLALLAIVFLMD